MYILEYSNISNYGDSVTQTLEVGWKLKNRAASEDEGGLGQRAFTASGQCRCCERRHGIQAPGRFPLAGQVPSSGSAQLGRESG